MFYFQAYSCALHREILIHGRLYVGESHLCFYANLFGWVTSVVIAFNDIISVDKRNTALVFPNAILVCTLHHRYLFASFLFREQAFAQIIFNWKAVLKNQTELSDFFVNNDGEYSCFAANEFSQRKDNELNHESIALETPFMPKCRMRSRNHITHLSVLGFQLRSKVDVESLLAVFKDGFFKVFQISLSTQTSESGIQSLDAIVDMSFTFDDHLRCQVQQFYAFYEESERYVLDFIFTFFKTGEFNFKILSRYSFVALPDQGSSLVATFDVQQFDKLFFKESMNGSIIQDFRKLLCSLQAIMLHRLGERRHDISPCDKSMESYFDASSFWHSFLPLVIVLLCIYLIITNVIRDSSSIMPFSDERNSFLNNISTETRKFVGSCFSKSQNDLSFLKSLVQSVVAELTHYTE